MEKLLARDHLLSLISTPIIWAAHFVACYALVSIVCAADDARRLAGIDMAALGVAIASAIALLLIACAGALNYRKWRLLRQAHGNHGGQHMTDDSQKGISAFFSISSMLLSALSALAVIWVALPALMLPACAA